MPPLELLGERFPAQLREPFDAIGIEPAEFPGVHPGLQEKHDLSPTHNESRMMRGHHREGGERYGTSDRLCTGQHG
jgi:hypothetical protein